MSSRQLLSYVLYVFRMLGSPLLELRLCLVETKFILEVPDGAIESL